MKCLGFRVQVVVRYHGHHITNIQCRPNTRIHIGFLSELVSSNIAVAEPSVGNVFCGFLDIGFGVGTLFLTLSAIPLSEHL